MKGVTRSPHRAGPQRSSRQVTGVGELYCEGEETRRQSERVALITGASQGLGLEIARLLAREVARRVRTARGAGATLARAGRRARRHRHPGVRRGPRRHEYPDAPRGGAGRGPVLPAGTRRPRTCVRAPGRGRDGTVRPVRGAEARAGRGWNGTTMIATERLLDFNLP